MFTTDWKLTNAAAATAPVSQAYCYLNYLQIDISCVATSGKVTLTLTGGSIGSNTTFVLTNLVNFNNASPTVSVKSYWIDTDSSFVEIDRFDNFRLTYSTDNISKVTEYVLLFREFGGANYD
mmetsp:Transcript_25897/g.4388  ORF Transcript_25897/g.4388 Transcript_25897/m.4388 type:complete len:122 (-) Transcript_25897:5216-5581(-)